MVVARVVVARVIVARVVVARVVVARVVLARVGVASRQKGGAQARHQLWAQHFSDAVNPGLYESQRPVNPSNPSALKIERSRVLCERGG